jgi:hypothetical protein
MKLASISLSQTVNHLRSSDPLKGLLEVAFVAATSVAANSVALGFLPLKRLSQPAQDRYLGSCVQCGNSVSHEDPFLRYHGEYYHAHGCIENHPPALTRSDDVVDAAANR